MKNLPGDPGALLPGQSWLYAKLKKSGILSFN
jgi:hypothetical protein